MHYQKTIFLITLFANLAFAGQGEQWAQEDKAKFESELEVERDRLKKNTAYMHQESSRLEGHRKELERLRTMEEKRSETKLKLQSRIATSASSLGVLEKKFSRKAKFYDCLQETLSKDEYVNVSGCRRLHPDRFSAEEERELNEWTAALGLSKEDLKKKLEDLDKQITRSETVVKNSDHYIKTGEARIGRLEENLKRSEELVKEYAELESHRAFVDCNATTPPINLEDETPYQGATMRGPFFNVPRDNQDGLGTCYANAARNLLIGLSGGTVDASFMDIALRYKEGEGKLALEGLDAGESCRSLQAVREKDYCPQKYASLEAGEKNHAIEGLFGNISADSLWIQSRTMSLLKAFLQGQDGLSKLAPEVRGEIEKKGAWMIRELKANPLIKLPLPVARVDVPPFWRLRLSYFDKKEKIGLSEEKFYEEYRAAYAKFYPKYLKALLKKQKPEQIFALFRKDLGPFIEKYDFGDHLKEWERVYLIETNEDYKNKNFQKSLKDSLGFLKKLLNREGLNDEQFLDFCVSEHGPTLDFLGKLGPLLGKMKDLGGKPERLLGKDGSFLSGGELMQLAVAPACLNPANREKIPFEFGCDPGYRFFNRMEEAKLSPEERTRLIRERVVMGLVKGLPVGNTTEGHINTIVGLRFNPDSKSCEYLIRESQNGLSEWKAEEQIIDNIKSLTEVRRR